MNLVDVPELNETLKFLGDLAPDAWYANCDAEINIEYFKSERHNNYYNYIEFRKITKILSAMYNLHVMKRIPYKSLLERLSKYITKETVQEYHDYIWDSKTEVFHVSKGYLNMKTIEYIGECVYKYCVPLEDAISLTRKMIIHKMIHAYDLWEQYSEMCEKYESYDPEPSIDFKQV